MQLTVPAIASATPGKLVNGLLDGLIALRFATTGVFELSAVGGWETAAGALGLRSA